MHHQASDASAPRARASSRRAIVLAIVFVVLAGTATTVFLVPLIRRSLLPVPRPPATATVEPAPADPAESTALAEARSLTDYFALDDAELVLRGVLRRNPKNALAHAYMARVAYKRGLHTDGTCAANAVAEAESELARAEELAPGLADALVGRAYLRIFAGDLQGAWKIAGEALTADPTSVRIFLLHAQIADTAGDLDHSERFALKIVDRVREGWVLDRAYDILANVYKQRNELGRIRALHATPEWQHGSDTWGKPR